MSKTSAPIDVAPEDQILLLMTCISEETEERRSIAARRVREDEQETALAALVCRSRKRQILAKGLMDARKNGSTATFFCVPAGNILLESE